MQKSINYWSFPGGLEAKKSLSEFFAEAKAAGFPAVELCCAESGPLTLKTTLKECADIRAKAEKNGLKIASLASGIYWSYSLGGDKVTDRNRAE